jgi:hypothetical protein
MQMTIIDEPSIFQEEKDANHKKRKGNTRYVCARRGIVSCHEEGGTGDHSLVVLVLVFGSS